MTVATTVLVAGPFTGTGAAANLPFTFTALAQSDVQLVRNGASLSYGGDYTVTLNADQTASPGGTVKVTASANTLGSSFYIYSNAPLSQPTSLPSQSPWYPKVVEKMVDRVALLVKQLDLKLYRTLKAPVGETIGDLPTKASRIGKVLAFDANGDPTLITAPDGTDTSLRTDLAASTGATLVGLALGTIARSLASIIGLSVAYVPEDFGAVGGGVTNDGAALQLFFDAGGELRLPRKAYRSSQTLVGRKNFHLQGAGYGFDALQTYATMPGSKIIFDAGVGGIDLQPQWTSTGWGSLTPVQEGAYGCVIENLGLIGGGGATAVGFHTRTATTARNVTVEGFSGKAFDIAASVGNYPGSESGNASLSVFERCTAVNNGGDGFCARGSDTNVIKFDTCNSNSNGGWGFNDSSEFNNTYLNCHASANAGGSYRATSAVAPHVYLGCYLEGASNATIDISAPCVIVGGTLAGPAASSLNVKSGGTIPVLLADGYTSVPALHVNTAYWGGGGATLNTTDYGIIAGHAVYGLVSQTGVGNAFSWFNNSGALCAIMYGDKSFHPQGNVDIDDVTKSYRVGGTKVVGSQGAAITDVAPAAAAPTQAEFNALVTSHNNLLARLRGSTGHGLIAG